MDLILTSFGLGMKDGGDENAFYRLPPLIFHRASGRLTLDNAGLLMFDRVVVDALSYERVLHPSVPDGPWITPEIKDQLRRATEEYSDFLKALEKSGRLIPKNFDRIISDNKQLLQQALQYDMKNITKWATPFQASLEKWHSLVDRLRLVGQQNRDKPTDLEVQEAEFSAAQAHSLASRFYPIHECVEALKNWKKKQPVSLRDMSRDFLRDYLSYVNINVMLSYEYESPFIDWEDMEPFYEMKFKTAGRHEQPGRSAMIQSRKLFEVVFPYFSPRSYKALARAINDKRVDELRNLVSDAVAGKVDFDSDFAIRTLKEVLKVERYANIRRKITGWATLPLGLIPVLGTGVQKGAEEGLNAVWSGRPLRKYNWFYFIDELSIKDTKAKA
jgi:hypothetical protein